MRATRARVPAGLLGGGGAVRWNLGGLGHIDHRKLVVVDGRSAGSVGRDRGSLPGRPLPRSLPPRRRPCRRAAPARLPGRLSLAAGCGPARRARRPVPCRGRGLDPLPVVLHNAPGRTGRLPTRSRTSSRTHATTLDVVNPYVTDRAMIGGIAARRRGVQCPPVRPRETEQLGARAAQLHHATLLDAGVRILEYPAMLMRRRSYETARSCSREPAISRPGA